MADTEELVRALVGRELVLERQVRYGCSEMHAEAMYHPDGHVVTETVRWTVTGVE